jgi:hypothetical protein
VATTQPSAEWTALVRHPRFREAVECNAAQILAARDGFGPVLKWIMNDLGRASTLSRICQLLGVFGGVSVGDLLERTRVRNTASDGRVLQILRRAEKAGLIGIVAGRGPASERAIAPQPLMFEMFRRRVATEIASASLMAPEIRPALARLADDAFLLAFMARLDRFDGMSPAQRGPANPGVRRFLWHEGGLVMLYDLLLRQQPARPRLLTEAPFSKARLAARFNLSRTHVRRVFAEAEEKGDVAFPSLGRIAFAPSLSDEAERHFALTFFVITSCANATLTEPESPSTQST